MQDNFGSEAAEAEALGSEAIGKAAASTHCLQQRTFLFACLLSGWATSTPQQVDCLAPK